MSKHISERWKPEDVLQRENVVDIRNQDGRRICSVPADYPLSGASWQRRITLIAAAPEMYELIAHVAAATESGYGSMMSAAQLAETLLQLRKQAKQLMAKIEGGEQ